MNCSTSGFPVLHYLLELVQTHVHWVSDAISSSITPFSFCPQSFPASGLSNEPTLCVRWPVYWNSALASIFPVNIQGWFPLGLTSLISLQYKGPSKVFSNTTVWKHQLFGAQPSLFSLIFIRDYWKNHSFVSKMMSLLFNTLSRFVIAFLPRDERLLISWLLTIHIDFGAQENIIEHGDYS